MSEQAYLEKIRLNESDFITKGRHNILYRHPNNPNYLVKVLGIVKVLGLVKSPYALKGLEDRLTNSTWLGNNKLMRSINRFLLMKAHLREFIEIVRLRFQNEFVCQPPLFMQKVISFADTNLGFAMVVKAEKGRNGEYAPTLSQLMANNKINETIKLQLEELYKQLDTYDVILSDLHPDNIVYSYDETNGDHLVLIDGVGDKNIIPILRLSRFLRKRIRQREIKQLKKRSPMLA